MRLHKQHNKRRLAFAPNAAVLGSKGPCQVPAFYKALLMVMFFTISIVLRGVSQSTYEKKEGRLWDAKV